MRGVLQRKDDEMKKATNREDLFCRLYVALGNPAEAAVKAGYKICPEIQGRKLLAKSYIRESVEKIRKEENISSYDVRNGLRRIAFASSADAVKLLFSENAENADFDSLDLFNVAEIKRPKGGGLEIKFFDRIKALEKLGDISEIAVQDAGQSFYEALEKSASTLSGEKSEI